MYKISIIIGSIIYFFQSLTHASNYIDSHENQLDQLHKVCWSKDKNLILVNYLAKDRYTVYAVIKDTKSGIEFYRYRSKGETTDFDINDFYDFESFIDHV